MDYFDRSLTSGVSRERLRRCPTRYQRYSGVFQVIDKDLDKLGMIAVSLRLEEIEYFPEDNSDMSDSLRTVTIQVAALPPRPANDDSRI